jgi:hypothetical protein
MADEVDAGHQGDHRSTGRLPTYSNRFSGCHQHNIALAKGDAKIQPALLITGFKALGGRIEPRNALDFRWRTQLGQQFSAGVLLGEVIRNPFLRVFGYLLPWLLSRTFWDRFPGR